MARNKTGKEGTLAERFLRDARESQWPLSLYLVNGFQLKGKILAFDEETILFQHRDVHQLVMRPAVAGMYPLPKEDSDEWWREYSP